jgi:hypothetical protein
MKRVKILFLLITLFALIVNCKNTNKKEICSNITEHREKYLENVIKEINEIITLLELDNYEIYICSNEILNDDNYKWKGKLDVNLESSLVIGDNGMKYFDMSALYEWMLINSIIKNYKLDVKENIIFRDISVIIYFYKYICEQKKDNLLEILNTLIENNECGNNILIAYRIKK